MQFTDNKILNMKYIITILGVVVLLFSCDGKNQQTDLIKQHYRELHNVTDKELELFRFDIVEVLGKDAYKNSFDRMSKIYLQAIEAGGKDLAQKTDKRIDTLGLSYDKIKDKKYFRVDAYRLNGSDTVSKSIYFLTDKNKIYDFSYVK